MPSALLVVDVQYDFLPGGALGVNGGNEILPVIQKTLEGKWDLVVATQDFHPPGHISFASTHGKEPFQAIEVPYPYAKEGEPATVTQMLWPDHCVQGSHGADIESTIHSSFMEWVNNAKGFVVQKGTDKLVDAYSAFASSPPVEPAESPLSKRLFTHQIDKVFVVGLATDYCVRYCSLDARKAGFDVYVIEEAVRAVGGEEATSDVFAQLKQAGVHIVSVEDPMIKSFLV